MIQISLQASKKIIAGKMSGAMLSGIAAIITACTSSITNLVATGVSTYLGVSQSDRTEGSYKTANGTNLSWSDKNNSSNNSKHSEILFV